MNHKENTPGVYAQYTYNKNERLILMAGIRVDDSNVYGTFITPRLHIKYMLQTLSVSSCQQEKDIVHRLRMRKTAICWPVDVTSWLMNR